MQAGLDSLGVVDLCNAISSTFGIEVPATLAFDYPNAAALAGFIVSKQHAATVLAMAVHNKGLAASGASWATQPSSDTAVRPGRGSITAQLQEIVVQVLGAGVTPHAPLMEVCMYVCWQARFSDDPTSPCLPFVRGLQSNCRWH